MEPTRLGRIKSRLQPLDCLPVQHHHIKTAGRQLAQTHQVVPSRKNNSTLFDVTHACGSATMVSVDPAAHLDEYMGAIGCPRDEIYFSAAAAGRPIIAGNQLQALALQIAQSLIFGGIAALFDGAQRRGF